MQALLEADFNVPIKNQVLLFRGRELKEPKKTLSEYGIKNHDVVILAKRGKTNGGSGGSGGGVKAAATGSSSRTTAPASGGNSSSSSRGGSTARTAQDFWSQEPEVLRRLILADQNLLRTITLVPLHRYNVFLIYSYCILTVGFL